jgi:hypothetical protein
MNREKCKNIQNKIKTRIDKKRWPGTGSIKKAYTIYYSGTRGRTGQTGTDFIVMGKMQTHVTEFLPLNNRDLDHKG